MGRRRLSARNSLVLALLGALLGLSMALLTPPASAAVRTGIIVVTIKTPVGVPGKVRLVSGSLVRVAKKPAAGSSIKVRFRVPIGRWRVVPQKIATTSALYGGTATKSIVTVRTGQTSAVTVGYRKLTSMGTLAITTKTPEGVPGTVRLQSGASTRTATKAPTGTTSTVKLTVPAGTWQVSPQKVVQDSALYAGVASRSSLAVPPGGTASVTVNYTKAPSIDDLHVVVIEPTRVQLAWTAPSAGASYLVRRALGSTPPASVLSGTSVTPDGASVTDTDIDPGETYSYSVFAQAAGSTTWIGPVSTVVTAPPTVVSDEAAAVVTNPSTVLITDPSAVATSAANGRVTTTVPSGRIPALGQSWVLPPDTDLPTGFLGKVVSVSADGKSVGLAPAGLADAFDYLDISVPSFSALPTGSLQAVSGPTTSEGSTAAAGLFSCSSGVDGSLSIDRDLSPFGDIRATLTKIKIAGKNIPVGASFKGEFGVKAKLEASAAIEGSASCELNLPMVAVPFMAGPVPMILTAQPTGSASVSGTVTEKVGVTASVGAEFEGYFGLGGEDFIDGDLVTSIDPYADVTVAGSLSLNIGADISLGIGSGNPKAGALVGATATFTALDAQANAVLGQNCLEVTATRSVSVALEAKAWLGDKDVSRSLDVPFLNGSADWGGSPWTYPNTCAPAEYRIASGSMNVSTSWSGGCNNTGWCDDNSADTNRSEAFSTSSAASLRVADGGGEWTPRFDSDPEADDYLHAPMVFNSWNYDSERTSKYSGYGCSETWTDQTVGPVEFGGAFWQSGLVTAPLPDQGLRASLLDGSYGADKPPVGEWTNSYWYSLGAWDTDYSNGFPRVPYRSTYSGSVACGWEPWQSEIYDGGLEHLAIGLAWWWSPEESRLTSSTSAVTQLEGCTPDACSYQVQGTDTYEFRSTVGGDDCNCGINGTGSATVTWSYTVESRTPEEPAAG